MGHVKLEAGEELDLLDDDDIAWGDDQQADEDGIPDMEESFDERAAVASAQEKAADKPDERQRAMMPPALVGTRWVDLGAIHRDGDTQSRVRLDMTIVQDYAQQFERNAADMERKTDSYALWWADFPPVDVFFDEQYWLADGFHRLAGIHQALAKTGLHVSAIGKWRVLCRVFLGSRRDAILYGAGANANHGLRRTNADKRKAIETLLRDAEWVKWSDHQIARACSVDHKTVASVRERLETTREIPSDMQRKTADGRVMNTANIGRKPEPVERVRPQRPTPTPPPATVRYVEPQTPADLVAAGYELVQGEYGGWTWRNAAGDMGDYWTRDLAIDDARKRIELTPATEPRRVIIDNVELHQAGFYIEATPKGTYRYVWPRYDGTIEYGPHRPSPSYATDDAEDFHAKFHRPEPTPAPTVEEPPIPAELTAFTDAPAEPKILSTASAGNYPLIFNGFEIQETDQGWRYRWRRYDGDRFGEMVADRAAATVAATEALAAYSAGKELTVNGYVLHDYVMDRLISTPATDINFKMAFDDATADQLREALQYIPADAQKAKRAKIEARLRKLEREQPKSELATSAHTLSQTEWIDREVAAYEAEARTEFERGKAEESGEPEQRQASPAGVTVVLSHDQAQALHADLLTHYPGRQLSVGYCNTLAGIIYRALEGEVADA